MESRSGRLMSPTCIISTCEQDQLTHKTKIYPCPLLDCSSSCITLGREQDLMTHETKILPLLKIKKCYIYVNFLFFLHLYFKLNNFVLFRTLL